MIRKLYRWLYRVTSRPDEKGERFGGRWQGAVRQKALEMVRGSRGKALEIGFGSGLFCLKLAAREHDLEVWGVDTNKALVREVGKKSQERGIENLHLEYQDGNSLSFGDSTFDIVVGINLFLNIDAGSMSRLLKEMKRVCKDSGRIIFDFRNSLNPFCVVKYRLAKYYDDTAPYPLYTYKPSAIEAILAEAGLRTGRRIEMGFPVKKFAPIIMVEAVKI